MRVRCSAPGKLFLMGEYAVLNGSPAVIASVNRFAYADVEEAEQFSVYSPVFFSSPATFELAGNNRPVFNGANIPEGLTGYIILVLQTVFNYLTDGKEKTKPVKITLDTSAFFSEGIKYGIGSSAALTSALTGALWKYYKKNEPDKKSLFDLAFRAHSAFQGKKGSGGDVASAVYGGLIEFYSVGRINEIFVQNLSGITVVPVFAGKSASTAGYLGNIEEYKTKNPEEYREFMKVLDEYARGAADALKQGDGNEFVEYIPRYRDTLALLGEKAGIDIYSKEHRKIAELTGEYGGIYKPSGAGGGDIGTAFFKGIHNSEKLKNALEKEGFTIPGFEITGRGIKFES